jgi:uncharacterized membrane protein YhaH (DUF805 family)
MEKNRKELRTISLLILVLVGFDMINRIINACTNGLPKPTDIPADMSPATAEVITIVAFVLSFVLFLPQIYIAVKGLKIANGAHSGKAPVIWAFILMVFAIIALIAAISNATENFNHDTAFSLFETALDIVTFAFFIVLARKIAKEQ